MGLFALFSVSGIYKDLRLPTFPGEACILLEFLIRKSFLAPMFSYAYEYCMSGLDCFEKRYRL